MGYIIHEVHVRMLERLFRNPCDEREVASLKVLGTLDDKDKLDLPNDLGLTPGGKALL